MGKRVSVGGPDFVQQGQRTPTTDSDLAQMNLLRVSPSSDQIAGGDVDRTDQESILQLVRRTQFRLVTTGRVERYIRLAL